MSFVRSLSWRAMVLCLVATAPWLMAAQCWSKIQNATIPVTISESTSFDVDIDEYTKGKFAGMTGTLPKGTPETSFPIDVKQDIDLTSNAQLKSAIDKYGNKVASVVIEKMEVQVDSNTATIDIPRVDLKMADKGATPKDLIGYLSGIPAGQKPTENIIKDDAARTTISAYLTKFMFSFGASTKITAKEGTAVPKGKIKMTLNFTVTINIQPLK